MPVTRELPDEEGCSGCRTPRNSAAAALLVDAGTPGLSIAAPERKMGLRASPVALSALDSGRLGIAAGRHLYLVAARHQPDPAAGHQPPPAESDPLIMTVYLCHQQPDLLDFEAEVLDSQPGEVLLSRSALHPGGGGQVCDVATLEHRNGMVMITSVRPEGDRYWHLLDDPRAVISGPVSVRIDAERRSRVSQLHTDTHLLNALVFARYAGALVTGAQINADGTARMDFDLPDADSESLRKLEPALNDLIANAIEVRAMYLPAAAAETTPGLIRSLSVAPPPTPDGMLRIIEIADVDRQACGGTHLSNTAQSRPVQITKVENKGRRNRRIRLRFAPG